MKITLMDENQNVIDTVEGDQVRVCGQARIDVLVAGETVYSKEVPLTEIKETEKE